MKPSLAARTLAGLLSGLVLCSAAAAEPAARSGIYDSLYLVTAGQAVAGVFAEQRGMDGPGGAPQFGCIFLLHGTLEGDRATVETWFPKEPERIPGTLAFEEKGAALTLREDHGGCPMTTGTMAGRPYALSREEEGRGWAGVALVTAEKAIFRSGPGASPPRSPYVVRLDPLVVLERRQGWVRASYLGGKTPITGWLPESDLALVMP